MELINSRNISVPKPIVATVGFFDGVHTGHKYLIDQVKKIAKDNNLPSAVITFPIHPRKVLQKDYQPALLCGYEEKIKRLAETGIDYCIELDFTVEVSKLTAREFMHSILKKELHTEILVIGYDHRFGHNREEDFIDYTHYGNEVGMKVIKALELDPHQHVSSSRIRRLLGNGEVVKAAQLLSYNYTISGKIVEGFKVGRTIGFPTANMEIWEDFKVIPAFGVYAVFVYVNGLKHCGMLYIGKRPTLQNGDNISLEVNIFDFDEDLYNKSLTVELVEFIRPDEKFSSVERLKKQIYSDKESVKKILNKTRF